MFSPGGFHDGYGSNIICSRRFLDLTKFSKQKYLSENLRILIMPSIKAKLPSVRIFEILTFVNRYACKFEH